MLSYKIKKNGAISPFSLIIAFSKAKSHLLFASARIFLRIGFGVFFYFLVPKTFYEGERESVPIPFLRTLERTDLAERCSIHRWSFKNIDQLQTGLDLCNRENLGHRNIMEEIVLIRD